MTTCWLKTKNRGILHLAKINLKLIRGQLATLIVSFKLFKRDILYLKIKHKQPSKKYSVTPTLAQHNAYMFTFNGLIIH